VQVSQQSRSPPLSQTSQTSLWSSMELLRRPFLALLLVSFAEVTSTLLCTLLLRSFKMSASSTCSALPTAGESKTLGQPTKARDIYTSYLSLDFGIPIAP
jgi:hypothetical protein